MAQSKLMKVRAGGIVLLMNASSHGPRETVVWLTFTYGRLRKKMENHKDGTHDIEIGLKRSKYHADKSVLPFAKCHSIRRMGWC